MCLYLEAFSAYSVRSPAAVSLHPVVDLLYSLRPLRFSPCVLQNSEQFYSDLQAVRPAP